MPVKVFTLEEATRLLPEVENSIRIMRQCVEEVHRASDQVQVLEVIGAGESGSPEHDELTERRSELEGWRETFRREHDRLSRRGVILRDVRSGLIDFPALHRGRLVYLCWRLGESRVGYWHETTSGFSGRRPVAELEPDAGAGDEGHA